MTDDVRVQIAAYITGNLSSEEVDKFEKAMAKDPELKEEVDLERQLYLHLNGDSDENRPPENEYTDALRAAMRSDEVKELKTKLLNT